jgi:NitT/TauT family transport system substrate-binding protein
MLLISGLLAGVTSCQIEEVVGPPEKITIAYSTIPYTALFQVAFEKGFFLTEGLDVTPQPHPFGKVALDAVLEGKADIATPADTPIMFAVTSGKKIYAVAEIAISNKSLAIIARKDRGIASPLDLRGKNVGASLGTTGDFFMDSFLITRGIGRNEVNIVDMKPDEMLDALLKGRVDAVSTWIPNIQYVQNGLGDTSITFYDEAIFNELICLAASQEFVEQHPETIKKVLRALIRAEMFIKKNPEESKRLVAAFIKIDRPLLDTIWDSFDFRVTLDQSLLISLEDQTRWAMKNRLTEIASTPNYLNYIYFDGLATVKPEAVRIIR